MGHLTINLLENQNSFQGNIQRQHQNQNQQHLFHQQKQQQAGPSTVSTKRTLDQLSSVKDIVGEVERVFASRDRELFTLNNQLHSAVQQLRYVKKQTCEQASYLSKFSANVSCNKSKYEEIEIKYAMFKKNNFDKTIENIDNFSRLLSENGSLLYDIFF